MKIGIIGSTGKLGAALRNKAKESNHFEVTSIVRNASILSHKEHYIQKDLFSLTPKDVEIFDWVICAYGPSLNNTDELIRATEHMIEIFQNQDTKLAICGGVGPLYFDCNHETRVSESPDVPEDFRALAKAEAIAFDLLNKNRHFNWLYFAPPFELSLTHAVTNKYVLANDILRFSTNGTSILSYDDFATAILDTLSGDADLTHKIVSVSEE